MNKESVMEILNRIFRDNFDDESIYLSESTTAMDIEDWDSLEQINLIVAIEKEFNIKFDIDETSFLNVGEMIETIIKKID